MSKFGIQKFAYNILFDTIFLVRRSLEYGLYNMVMYVHIVIIVISLILFVREFILGYNVFIYCRVLCGKIEWQI